jgi:hypothetical protein
MANSFLADFMKMRKTMGTPEMTLPVIGGLAEPAKPKKGRKPKDAPQVSKPTGDAISMHYIISERPDVEEVCEYFRNRIAELETEDA